MEALQDFFNSLKGVWGYLFLFMSSLGENLFPPLPGDTFVILGAFLVGMGHLHFLPAYLATTCGSFAGFMILFFVGRRWGRRFLGVGRWQIFSQDRFDRVEVWFNRYGYWVIGFNRFLSGFRSVVSFAAGTAGMKSKNVMVLALLGCVVWNAILMGVGIWIGENWTEIIRSYQRVVFILICIFILFWWIKAVWRKKREV